MSATLGSTVSSRCITRSAASSSARISAAYPSCRPASARSARSATTFPIAGILFFARLVRSHSSWSWLPWGSLPRGSLRSGAESDLSASPHLRRPSICCAATRSIDKSSTVVHDPGAVGQDPLVDTESSPAGLGAQARVRPDAPALAVGDDTWTFGELDAAARDLAHALHDLGVRRGAKVAVLVPNSA